MILNTSLKCYIILTGSCNYRVTMHIKCKRRSNRDALRLRNMTIFQNNGHFENISKDMIYRQTCVQIFFTILMLKNATKNSYPFSFPFSPIKHFFLLHSHFKYKFHSKIYFFQFSNPLTYTYKMKTNKKFVVV